MCVARIWTRQAWRPWRLCSLPLKSESSWDNVRELCYWCVWQGSGPGEHGGRGVSVRCLCSLRAAETMWESCVTGLCGRDLDQASMEAVASLLAASVVWVQLRQCERVVLLVCVAGIWTRRAWRPWRLCSLDCLCSLRRATGETWWRQSHSYSSSKACTYCRCTRQVSDRLVNKCERSYSNVIAMWMLVVNNSTEIEIWIWDATSNG